MALLVAALAACTEPGPSVSGTAPSAPDPVQEAPPPADTGDLPYDFGTPDFVFELPSELNEISGLTVLSNGNLGAVQDEDGILFEIDGQTGRVLTKEQFRKDGDYEGIEATPDALWVLKSDGTLYEVSRTSGGLRSESINTDLSGRNDTEGLGYDADNNRLLIALKGHPGKGLGKVRAVFAFDLVTRTLSTAPVFTLDRDVIDAGGEAFKPSALAVRPGTGEIYILSSVKKALLVVDGNGTIHDAVTLPAALYRQPEGIAFTSDGTLFISNEGAGGSATLLRISPR